MAEAEEARQIEVAAAIVEIKAKMDMYGLTLQDLKLPDSKSHKSTAPIKYRGPNRQGWSGGRGRKPDWVLQALKEGKNIEDVRV